MLSEALSEVESVPARSGNPSVVCTYFTACSTKLADGRASKFVQARTSHSCSNREKKKERKDTEGRTLQAIHECLVMMSQQKLQL